jgi:SAM-dependent methyltransferase
LQFVIHECPQQTITDFVQASARIVRPGGVLYFVDNNPRSETIQNLPPAIFTLMKVMEEDAAILEANCAASL